MYVGTSKGTSTYRFYDFSENRRSPVYDAIQENHPRKRLVQSFLYALILYKTPIQTYRNSTIIHLESSYSSQDPSRNKSERNQFSRSQDIEARFARA